MIFEELQGALLLILQWFVPRGVPYVCATLWIINKQWNNSGWCNGAELTCAYPINY